MVHVDFTARFNREVYIMSGSYPSDSSSLYVCAHYALHCMYMYSIKRDDKERDMILQ